MEYSLSMLFVIFIIYSFVGWIIESVYVYYCIQKLMNRGFLIGPCCPIYGFGCLLFILLLPKYKEDPLVVFVLAATICSVLEYITSWLMEKLFKARWWDYSDKKFNIAGRICLENALSFGIGALAVIYIIHPIFKPILVSIPSSIINIIAIILGAIFIIDMLVSLQIITSFKNVAKSIHKDSTEEITKKVREKLVSRGGLYKRLVSAFNFEASENLLNSLRARLKNDKSKARKKYKEEKKRLKDAAKQDKNNNK